MRKAEQSERTRGALIDAAIRLFGERGYRATPLKAIGEAAGISHGVIPFHFGSKEGLLLAVVERCFDVFQRGVLGALDDSERDHGLGDLRALMDAQKRFAEEHPENRSALLGVDVRSDRTEPGAPRALRRVSRADARARLRLAARRHAAGSAPR